MTRTQADLGIDDRNRIAQFILVNCTNGKVRRGSIKEAAASFGVCRRTVHYIWNSTKEQVSSGLPILFTSNKIGIPKKKRLHLDKDKMKSIPPNKRTTIRRLARELDMSKSHIGRLIKDKEILPHTNAIKPTITELNMIQRLKYSLKDLKMDRAANIIKFTIMHNVVHIDEKWFYMTTATERMYKLPDEEEPYRTCKNKRYIPKVMFMSAVSRPMYSSDGQLLFDGKIGIYPFTKQEPAQRNSRNRIRGTLVTKPIDSITKDVIRGCLINQIIPDIKAKWPPNACKNIFIQQDNAKPHILDTDLEFRAAASTDGFNIQLVCQPPNSPDTNINDLGWFRAIQSLQVETASYTVDELVTNVLISYEGLTPMTLNKVFLSLQQTLVEIMKVKGNNNFKGTHMNKEKLLREERLPLTLQVDEELVRGCIQHLIDIGQIGTSYDISGLMADLGYD